MPSDNRNNPPKPQTNNKDQKVRDLPQNKGVGSKDQQVKGGRGSKKAFDQ